MNNPTDLQIYYSDLMNELDHSSTSQGNYKELLFIDKILPYIEEQGVVDNLEPYHFYKPGSRYGRIDGLGFNGDFNDADLDQLQLVILINEFIHDDNIKSLTNSRIEQLKKAGVNFFNSSLKTQFIESLEESSDGYIAAKEIFQKYKRIESIKLIILTNAQISSRVADKKEIDEDLDIPLTIDIWDIKRIYDLESSQTKSEAIEIDLSEWGGPIPSLQATESDQLTSYLCVVNGQTIADLYDEYGARLLEANVRSFLQFRGKINKGIRKTIKTEPEYFFSYNNGLTATASDVEYDKSKQIITKINNLQIVNGGQTTASLLMTQKKDKADLSKIQVQLKLNVVSDAKSDELISNISRFANSQNAIKDSDFFSNHPFHRTLEKLSRQILAPTSKERIKPTRWYYERARGSYLNAQSKLTDAGKKSFKSEHPKEQLIIKTDLAKIYLIFDKRPHDAIKGAQIAFNGFAQSIEKIWDNNPETINDYFFKELVAKFVIWQACKKAVYKREEFVGNTKATLTAYTIYILKALMDKQDIEFNYPKVWQEQAVSDFYYDQFIETSIKINDLLNQLSEQTGKAVLSMAKSKETLIKVQSIIDKTDYFSLDMMFKTQLVSKSVIEEKRQDSAQQTKTVTKAVSSLIDLCNTPPAKWLALIKDAEEKGVLNETDKQVLSLVPNVLLGRSLKTPTDRQVDLINKTLVKLEDKGIYLEVG